MEEIHTRSRESLGDHIKQSFRDRRQTVHFIPFRIERRDEPLVLVSHLRQLRSDLPGQFNAVLD